MEKFLWKFHWYFGRQGDVNGLFVATEDEVENAIGGDVYFGEILGKHSEVRGTIERKDVTKVDIDSESVMKVANHLGMTWSGYNPLNYLRYDCDVCEERCSTEEMGEIGERNICSHCFEEESEKS